MLTFGAVNDGDEGFESLASGRTKRQRIDERRQTLLATSDVEQARVLGAAPVPVETLLHEGVIEGLAMRLLGIRKRAVDIEDEGLDLQEKTRLARRSSPSMVMSSSRVSATSARANRRFACRSRARSRALRIERALAKCG